MRRVGLLAVLGPMVVGCGGGDMRPVALIASSLRPALNAQGPDVRSSFEASSAIAAQVRQGSGADVVVVADPKILAALAREGLVESPAIVARNAIAVLVPLGNPRGLHSLADLAANGRRVVIASKGVPLGAYTRTVLARAGANGVLENVVTEEPDASGVVGKVAQGEVDAGIGYASDLASRRVDGFVVPDAVQVEVRYEAAVVTGTRRRPAAAAYVEWLTGPEGSAALVAAGFKTP